jgi:hypothetical protein
VSASTPNIPLPERLDRDPGDEVQRNFRYQHAYGVVLLLAAARGELPYRSLWCEHHEDFIAERKDGKHEAFQIKTATPENGAWDWKKDALRDSLKRFVRLQSDQPGDIAAFKFVSNVKALDTHAKAKIAKSPPRLVESVTAGQVAGDQEQTLHDLRDYCECSDDDLRYVISRLDFLLGPSRDGFNEEIAQKHLGLAQQCASMSPAQLASVLDQLIAILARASSMAISDPKKHWWPTTSLDRDAPFLLGKRVTSEALSNVLTEVASAPFRFLPSTGKLRLDGNGVGSRLEAKLVRGQLAEYVDLVRSRAVAAERHLMELVTRSPDAEALVTQIEGAVYGECQEARLVATHNGTVDGPEMLRETHSRLRRLASERPSMVGHQEYELLAGVAGLLTEGCRVWWSEIFDLRESV